MALLCTAAMVYAMPVGRRPIGLQDEARVMLLAEDTLRHGFRLPALLDRSVVEVPRRDRVARRLAGPAAGEVLMRVGDWAYFRRSAHPSWCAIGDVKVETRSYVLLGSCR
jgi:hypothetical protein